MTTTAIRAAAQPQTSPVTARDVAAAEYAALLAAVDAFDAADWDRPTDCTEWRARDVVAHLAGAAEEACRLPVMLRHLGRGVVGVGRGRGDLVDLLCSAQIGDRAHLTDPELAADLRRWAAGAPDGRRRQPRLVRRMALPAFAGLGRGARLAYLLDVIYVRDVWLHRVDLHRATGREMPRGTRRPRTGCGPPASSSETRVRSAGVARHDGAMPELVLPTTSVHESFLEAMDEFVAEGAENSQTAAWVEHNAPGWREPAAFEAFVEAVRADALEETPRPARHVPCTTLWWVEGDDYLGRLAIRHCLNDFLLDVGGHIGYDVRPTRRREGHATAMLRQALPWAHSLGIDPALVTCDDDNVASIRVIESVGGALEDVRRGKRRYWVPTS